MIHRVDAVQPIVQEDAEKSNHRPVEDRVEAHGDTEAVANEPRREA